MGLFSDLIGGMADIHISKNVMENAKTQTAKDLFEKYLQDNNIQNDEVEKMFCSEDLFVINKEIVMAGKLVKGTLRVGDKLKLVTSNGEVKQITVVQIEVFRKQIEEAHAGDNFGIRTDLTEKVDKHSILFQDNR